MQFSLQGLESSNKLWLERSTILQVFDGPGVVGLGAGGLGVGDRLKTPIEMPPGVKRYVGLVFFRFGMGPRAICLSWMSLLVWFSNPPEPT